MNNCIEIFSSLDIIKPSNKYIEFGIETQVKFLNSGTMWYNFYPRASSHDKLSNNFSLHSTNIFFPEQELPVKIGQINSIHINKMYISDTWQCKILNNFTSESSSSNYKYFVLLQTLQNVIVPILGIWLGDEWGLLWQ